MYVFLIVIIRKILLKRKLLVISPVHPVLETIIAAAAIAVVRDREPQGLVVQPVLWDLLVQEGVPGGLVLWDPEDAREQ